MFRSIGVSKLSIEAVPLPLTGALVGSEYLPFSGAKIASVLTFNSFTYTSAPPPKSVSRNPLSKEPVIGSLEYLHSLETIN